MLQILSHLINTNIHFSILEDIQDEHKKIEKKMSLAPLVKDHVNFSQYLASLSIHHSCYIINFSYLNLLLWSHCAKLKPDLVVKVLVWFSFKIVSNSPALHSIWPVFLKNTPLLDHNAIFFLYKIYILYYISGKFVQVMKKNQEYKYGNLAPKKQVQLNLY